ncbi:UDP-N-acetylmuramate dehydrogenase [candidate division WOR-3 bacterium]|nr:UDP-N-acetylmuramate dehydrogenase [candidate division WOR-3 bacterium]
MIDCLRKVELADFTSLKLGGKADYFCYVDNELKFDKIVTYCDKNSIPYIILGAGSNILFSDEGLRGCIVKFSGSFRNLNFRDNILRAGAGVTISEVISKSREAGMSGIECLYGIPGTVGGSVYMNAGTKWGAIGDFIKKVKTMDKDYFEVRKEDFKYRNGPREIILGVEFELRRKDPYEIESVIEKIKIFRNERFPRNSRTAGCIFKNPDGAPPAGKLIEQAGWKGKVVNNIIISDRHANYFIPMRGAKSSEFTDCMKIIQEDIMKRFSVKLEPELKIYDENGNNKEF